MKANLKLTEEDWRQVFQLRCRSKRGEYLSDEDLRLVIRAHGEDRERCAAMDSDVFDATAPFGSVTRWRK